MNKLSLWLNCSTGRDRAGTGRRGAYGQALGTNARLVIFPSLPPLLFFFPHCDRCRVAKFIPNLIAVRQWTQCWIVYYSQLKCPFTKAKAGIQILLKNYSIYKLTYHEFLDLQENRMKVAISYVKCLNRLSRSFRVRASLLLVVHGLCEYK